MYYTCIFARLFFFKLLSFLQLNDKDMKSSKFNQIIELDLKVSGKLIFLRAVILLRPKHFFAAINCTFFCVIYCLLDVYSIFYKILLDILLWLNHKLIPFPINIAKINTVSVKHAY